MPTEDNNTTEQQQGDSSSQEQTQENPSKEEEEDDVSEDEEVVFHPHKGKIMQILPYKRLSSLSFDKSYTEPTSTGKAELVFSTYDYPFIYSGVSCKLKVRRDTDRQFSATGIEEVYKTDEEIKAREHYPTEEQRLESTLSTPQKEFVSSDYNMLDVSSTMVSRSASDDGLYGFVTEVSHTQESTEISLKDWGYCLEDITKELDFKGMFRSEIMGEVVKSYGLVPILDFDGLDNDLISWTNKKKMSSGSSSSENDGTAEDSKTMSQCSRTYDLSINAKVSNKGDIPSEITSEMMGKIGKADTNYGKWAKGKTPQQVMEGLRSRFKYTRYSDNVDNCATDTFKDHIVCNCGDASRLVKCCMDVIGVDCICVHSPDHYYNAIKINGEWKTCDLTYGSSCKTRTGSNTFGY